MVTAGKISAAFIKSMLPYRPPRSFLSLDQGLGATGGVHERALAGPLREIWNRRRPAARLRPINWDPEGAERVVDLYIILALHNSGDDSFLPRISDRVAQAEGVLKGPDNELLNAARVIREIGRLEPIQDLVALAAKPEAAPNAVRTLQLLDLPDDWEYALPYSLLWRSMTRGCAMSAVNHKSERTCSG
jgi:hypothetical protein